MFTAKLTDYTHNAAYQAQLKNPAIAAVLAAFLLLKDAPNPQQTPLHAGLDAAFGAGVKAKLPAAFVSLVPTQHHTRIFETGFEDWGATAENFFVEVGAYPTKPREQCAWEAHTPGAEFEGNVDVMFAKAGGERIEYTEVANLTRIANPENYPVNLGPRWTWYHTPEASVPKESLLLNHQQIAIFEVPDAHSPQEHDGEHPSIEKLVGKLHQPTYVKGQAA